MELRSEHPSALHQRATASSDVVRARERFLSSHSVDADAVRRVILASWHRSADANVTADSLNAPFHEDLDVQGRLMHHATLVLDRLRNQLADQPVSVVLTDANGFVLDRRSGTYELERQLDDVLLAPGFSYAERFVGTNGIGTALEGGRATYVYQREHYTDQLGNLACAGVPLHDPLSGRLEGVLDITCWAEDANPLLMVMAQSAANDIESVMLGKSRGHELALLHEYMQTSRRCAEPVLAFSADVLMMNTKARNLLSTADQAALTEQFHTGAGGSRCLTAEIDLPSGTRCRVRVKHVHHGRHHAGTVARIQLKEPRQCLALPSTSGQPDLPGIVGSGPMWTQCCRELERDFRDHIPTALEGEPGTGKTALLRAMHQRHRPAGHLRVLDLADRRDSDDRVGELERELDTAETTLVLQHLDRLSPAECAELDAALRAHGPARALLTTTLDDSGGSASQAPGERSPELTLLLEHFPRSVQVPPLRHHVEDVEALAELFVRQTTKGAGPRFAPDAMRALLRATWPGNVAQLRRVVTQALKRTRAGTITLQDLPPECRGQTRRVLSPIESMERDAIVRSLTETGGNRTKAARTLGISRATIYRKINDYGIDLHQL